jgi:hypothetical protein
MMIAFPPCDYLTSSGLQWHHDGDVGRERSIEFIRELWAAPIERVAIENPVGVLRRRWRKWSQIVHPYMFGHSYTKATCLWLRNLPLLHETNRVRRGPSFAHLQSPSSHRKRDRSRTFEGFARAMAEQWG